MSVNVIKLNCQHSYDVMCELGTIMVNRNIDVALLQEPYVSNGSSVCVQLRSDIGTIYMFSLYCQFSLDISPFLNY